MHIVLFRIDEYSPSSRFFATSVASIIRPHEISTPRVVPLRI
jgi:hypothetical protein